MAVSYSHERREVILKKLLPPHSCTVAEVAEEEGISAAMLYDWPEAARRQSRLLPEQAARPEDWSSRDKFNEVRATAALSGAEPAELTVSAGRVLVF